MRNDETLANHSKIVNETNALPIDIATVKEPNTTQEIVTSNPNILPDIVTPGVSQTLQAITDFLTIGGPVVWILILFSTTAVCIALIKFWQFFNAKAESNIDIENSLLVWQQGHFDQSLSTLNQVKPISSIVYAAQLGCLDLPDSNDKNRKRLLDKHQVELSRLANELMQHFRSLLRPLEMIATLSPLLGLLGTVMGMIEAFQQMETAGNQVDPSVLSGGIWQALLTTAVGLSVAIPVVMLHGFFERKCERIAEYINDSVTRVFTQMPEQTLAASSINHVRVQDAA